MKIIVQKEKCSLSRGLVERDHHVTTKVIEKKQG
jgi:hypothetical protein